MFIIVKEIGGREYRGFDYEVIGYYHEETKAKYAVQLLEYEKSLQYKLNDLTCKYMIECDYVIKEIPDSCDMLPTIDDETRFLSEKNKILEKYASDIRDAKENRARMEEDKARIQEEKTKQEKERHKKEVLDFWDWWTRGPSSDPFFQEKKSAKIRGILPTMQQFFQDEPPTRDMYDFYVLHGARGIQPTYHK